MVWAALLWGLAVVSLIGTLFCGVVAAAGFWSNDYLDATGVTTSATVTHVEPFTDTITVEFTTDDGAPATAEFVWMGSDVPKVGEEIQITYDPTDPSFAFEAGSDSGIFLAVIYVVGAIIGLAVMVGAIVGAVLVHRKRGKAKRQYATW